MTKGAPRGTQNGPCGRNGVIDFQEKIFHEVTRRSTKKKAAPANETSPDIFFV